MVSQIYRKLISAHLSEAVDAMVLSLGFLWTVTVLISDHMFSYKNYMCYHMKPHPAS